MRDDLPDGGALPPARRHRRLRRRPLHRLQVVHAGLPLRRALHRPRHATPPPSATTARTAWRSGSSRPASSSARSRRSSPGDLDDPDERDRPAGRRASRSGAQARAGHAPQALLRRRRHADADADAPGRAGGDPVGAARRPSRCRSSRSPAAGSRRGRRQRRRSPSTRWAAPSTTCRTSRGRGAGASRRTSGPSRSRPARCSRRRSACSAASARCSALRPAGPRAPVPAAHRRPADRRPQAARPLPLPPPRSPTGARGSCWGAWILLAFGVVLGALAARGGRRARRRRSACWPCRSRCSRSARPATARSCSARRRGATSGRARSCSRTSWWRRRRPAPPSLSWWPRRRRPSRAGSLLLGLAARTSCSSSPSATRPHPEHRRGRAPRGRITRGRAAPRFWGGVVAARHAGPARCSLIPASGAASALAALLALVGL